jgi:hypothetical protein
MGPPPPPPLARQRQAEARAAPPTPSVLQPAPESPNPDNYNGLGQLLDGQPMEVSEDLTQQYGADEIPAGQQHPDDLQDGSADGRIDPCSAFTPHVPILQIEAGFPETHLAKDMAGWLLKNNRRLSTIAQEDFPEFVQKVRIAYEDSPVEGRPKLEDLATQWGLPPLLAAKMIPNTLYKIIAVAVVLAA